jgi:hypothetical protein
VPEFPDTDVPEFPDTDVPEFPDTDFPNQGNPSPDPNNPTPGPVPGPQPGDNPTTTPGTQPGDNPTTTPGTVPGSTPGNPGRPGTPPPGPGDTPEFPGHDPENPDEAVPGWNPNIDIPGDNPGDNPDTAVPGWNPNIDIPGDNPGQNPDTAVPGWDIDIDVPGGNPGDRGNNNTNQGTGNGIGFNLDNQPRNPDITDRTPGTDPRTDGGTPPPDISVPEDRPRIDDDPCPNGCVPEGDCMPIDICSQPCIQDILFRLGRIQNQLVGLEASLLDRILQVIGALADLQALTAPDYSDDFEAVQQRIQVLDESVEGQIDGIEELIRSLTPGTDNPNTGEEFPELDLIPRIYAILGGESWFSGDSQGITFNPEGAIEALRDSIYPETSGNARSITVATLPDYFRSMLAVMRHRSGHFRYPARVPYNIGRSEDDPREIIADVDWQLWLVENLDAWFGQYPIKMKYKNADGEVKDLELYNQAETLAEMMGILLTLSSDTDVLTELGFKATVEAIKAQTSAIQAADYGKAIADYLGFRSKASTRNLPLSINPKGTNIRDALSESTQKVQRFENVDKESLADYLKELLVGVAIIKAALYRPLNENRDELPGDRIREDIETSRDESDQEWLDFLNDVRNPTGIERNPLAPQVDVNNLSQESAENG